MTFSIDVHQDTLIKKLKPAVVKAYDYYESESQAKVMYTIGESECYGDKSKFREIRIITIKVQHIASKIAITYTKLIEKCID